jgi:hypothetical protein
MSFQTGIRLVSLPLIFWIIGILIAVSSSGMGFFALILGSIIGFVLTEIFYVPNTLRQWEITGAPGDSKTPEQQQLWEEEKNRRGKKRNLSIIGGVIGWALLKNYASPELQMFIVTAIPGGLAAWILRTAWLVYQKRGRLGP